MQYCRTNIRDGTGGLTSNVSVKHFRSCCSARCNKPRRPASVIRRVCTRSHALGDAQHDLQDALRKSQDAEEVLQLVDEQRQHLNCTLASTAVQKLALLPTAYLRAEDLANAVQRLATVASKDLAALPDPTATLWGFAELNIKSDAVQELLETFAIECWSQQQQASYTSISSPIQTDQSNTVVWAYTDNSDQACKNLVTTAWTLGRLSIDPSPHVADCMSSIAAELSKKLHNNMLKSAFSPDDLADIVDAFAMFLEPTPGGQPGFAQSFSRRNVGALLDTIAADVRQQLSNKHSMRAPFDPKSLVKLLTGFARLRHISSSSSGMLDAVAGFVIRRITAGHLNAVTKAADLAQLLQAYAALGHSTVVMPDLLTAVSNQLRKQLASEAERQSQFNTEAEEESYAQQRGPPAHMQLVVERAHLIDVLKAYHSLGYHPSQGLLTAIEPFLTGQPDHLPLEQALDLVTMLLAFHWQPGDLALRQVAMSLSAATDTANVKDLAQITSGLTDLRMLGYQPSEGQLMQLRNRQQQLKQLRRSW